MKTLLGPGFKGLLLTAFLAAFMSTIDTHLNWGASYITIDLYKRFFVPNAEERHYVRFSKLVIVLLMAGAGLVASFVESISGAWEFAFLMGSGIGLVLILRWFWWRINAVSEIVALASSTLLAFGNLLLENVAPDLPILGFTISEMPWHIKAFLIVPLTTAAWLLATFVTRPVSSERLSSFYKLVSPGGSWSPVSSELKGTGREVLNRRFVGKWVAGLALILGLNLGLGALCFGNASHGSILIMIAVLGVVWLLVSGNRGRGRLAQKGGSV
jgi:hypothetical protein